MSTYVSIATFRTVLKSPTQIEVHVPNKMICALYSAQPTLNIYTGFTPSQLMTNTSGCCYSL